MIRSADACIGLGGNLGDAAATIRQAIASLAATPGIEVLDVSRLYRTPAWGVTSQPDFINAAACIATSLPPRALLERLLEIERAAGRDRSDATRWGPRVLDLDILTYADQRIDEPGLTVPHPHLHERAFVLVPLHEIAPALLVPGRGRVDALLASVETGGLQALG